MDLGINIEHFKENIMFLLIRGASNQYEDLPATTKRAFVEEFNRLNHDNIKRKLGRAAAAAGIDISGPQP